jgi:hypothetical protein
LPAAGNENKEAMNPGKKGKISWVPLFAPANISFLINIFLVKFEDPGIISTWRRYG